MDKSDVSAKHSFGRERREGDGVQSAYCALEGGGIQLPDEDLAHLLGGQPNTGVANTFGWGNLPDYGVPSVMTADGPAGLRIAPECSVYTTAWPCATQLACSWNAELVERVGEAGGAEVKENNIAVWLTPAVNIHRSPLCGRNFEYYSEDFLGFQTGPAAFVRFAFLGFFGFFFEGKMSGILMDERYVENRTRAQLNAHKAAVNIIFAGLIVFGGFLGNVEYALIAFEIVVAFAVAIDMFLGEYLLYQYDQDDQER